jgi:hypothetical protein
MKDAPTIAFATSSKAAPTVLLTTTCRFLAELPSLISMKQNSLEEALVLLAQPPTLMTCPMNSS